jgi:hypothetical protein
VGLLAVDVTTHGVVMSADSQPVEILKWENRVLATSGGLTRDPVVTRVAGGFTGLVGFAGTETVDGIATGEWLRAFSNERAADDLSSFCRDSPSASRISGVAMLFSPSLRFS